MGCASSKQTRANAPVVVYRPPPSSFAVFDINSIEEPWLKLDNAFTLDDTHKQKPSLLPPPLLEKLDTLDKDDGPRSWDEVSKALEDLKKQPNPTPTPTPNPNPNPTPLKKNQSFHTLDELESQKQVDKKDDDETSKNQLMGIRLRKTGSFPDDSTRMESPDPGSGQGQDGFRSVKANPFIMRDRMEREKEGKEAAFDKIMKAKRDPLGDFPELCPPGGAYLVVLYTTSLGGVRRTFEDCNRARAILETHRVVFDERDVSLHGEFLTELKDLVGSGPGDGLGCLVPRLFVKGRCLGGAEEVVELNESGQLGRILSWARVERGPGWQGCEGCGGARFVPCLECGGSCKVVIEDTKERCPKCNENGLIHCPRCH